MSEPTSVTESAVADLLGRQLSELTDDPEGFVAALEDGLSRLSDAAYAPILLRVSPGVLPTYSVRRPLLHVVQRHLGAALRAGSSASALSLAQRLERSDAREVRLFALSCLERSLPDDPERSWQSLRRLGARAGDWIEIDSLAGVWAEGILAEAYRWAELEQLVYSERAMERRLVGATLACLPYRVGRSSRARLRGAQGSQALRIVALLIGDADRMVQKALSWALREWSKVDTEALQAFLRDQVAISVERHDGHRAVVLREALSTQPEPVAAELRGRLEGIRRRPGAPTTSDAARQASAFAAGFAGVDGGAASQGRRYVGVRS